MMRATTFGATVVWMLFSIAPILGNDKDHAGCQSDNYELRIEPCTRMIADRSESASNRAVAYILRAQARLQKGDFDRAIADYTEGLKFKPNGTAYHGRGVARENKGDINGAIADYTEAAKLSPNGGRSYHNRASLWFTKKDYKRAIADYSESIRLDPQYAPAYYGRCLVRAVVGRELQLALSDCNQSFDIQPVLPSNAAAAHDHRGLVFLKLDRFEKALDDYDSALRLKYWKGADSLYGRGVAKLRKGDRAGALADMDAAKKIDPGVVEKFVGYGIARDGSCTACKK